MSKFITMVGTNVGAVVGVEQNNSSPSSVITNIEQCKCSIVQDGIYLRNTAVGSCRVLVSASQGVLVLWTNNGNAHSFKYSVSPSQAAFMFTVFGCSAVSCHAV